ncbi:prepilin peptidase [Enterobacter cloacae subsp. cloacae]|uniref:prepilin peptidase n=1 Tax=Enterobacter cloacae TaxID=550 RepID=UPI001C5BE8D5|nr:prepilin peptidase [Enterobacter cloacae]MBW4204164.1 prepilin peptidase [Enterobacter cloacae subsp. cloacae]
MNLTALYLCTLPMIYPAGKVLLRISESYIERMDSVRKPENQMHHELFKVWLILCVVLIAVGMVGFLGPEQIIRGLLVGAWCLILAALDLARFWLPFRFTASLAITGVMYSIWVLPERNPAQLLAEISFIFIPLELVRLLANYIQKDEVFGKGDVWLITALVCWYPAFDVLAVTLIALSAAICTGAMTKQRYLPFGPFLCLFAVIPAFTTLDIII